MSGTFTATTSCGATASGALASGFELMFVWPYHHGGADRYTYMWRDSVAIVRLPLRATEAIDHGVFDLSGDGFPLDTGGAGGYAEFGCPYGYGRNFCVEESPYTHPGGHFSVERQITGWATTHTHAWPDTVRCGTTTPLPFTMIKADSTEGYVGPRATFAYRLPGGAGPTRGTLSYGGAQDGVFPIVPYGDARAGDVAYVAPACAAITQPTGVTLGVESVIGHALTVVPPPPVGFRLAPDPDTLGSGQAAWIPVVAVSAAGTETYLDPATPVTLSVSDAVLGTLSHRRQYSSTVVSGPTITVPYRSARGLDGVPVFDAIGETPERDTPVAIMATGGGLTGTGTVVRLGRLRLDLTARPDSIAVGGRSVLSARIVGDRAWDFPQSATVSFALDAGPSLGTLRRISTDQTGQTLAGVPRAEAAGGGVEFVAVARQGPPALARGGADGIAAADSVRAGARITATVDGRADLTDTARVTVGGTARIGLVVTSIGTEEAPAYRITVRLPPGDCASWPGVRIRLNGLRGDLVVSTTGQRVAVVEAGGSVTVSACDAAAGVVVFQPVNDGTVRIGPITAEFVTPAYTPEGEPILPVTVPFPPPRSGGGGDGGGSCPAPGTGAAGRPGDCPVPSVRLLRQNGAEVIEGYVRVSKVQPDWLLPETVLDFEAVSAVGSRRVPYRGRPDIPDLGYSANPDPDYYDPDTYRIEVANVPGSTVPSTVRLVLSIDGDQILVNGDERVGAPRATEAEYSAVCEPQVGGTLTCRTSKFIRLVSNAKPARGALGEYDDQYGDLQTIRVRLGQTIRVWWRIGTTNGTSVPYAVGASSGVDAVREGRLVWHTYGSENSQPDLATARASEDWAQAGIQFATRPSPSPTFSATTADNVVRIRFARGTAAARAPGTLRVPLTTSSGPCEATADIRTGMTVNDVAKDLRASLRTTGNLPGTGCPGIPFSETYTYSVNRTRIGASTVGEIETRFDEATEFFVVFGRYGRDRVVDPVGVGEGRFVRPARMDPNERFEDGSETAFTIAAALHDGAQQTIDVFVVPSRVIEQAIGSLTLAFTSYDGDRSFPPNVALIRPEFADERDDYPFGLGHEIGHALLVGPFAGSDPFGHHPFNGNLMFYASERRDAMEGSVTFREAYDSPKRLTRAQQRAARCESGPSTEAVSLACVLPDPADATNNPPLLVLPSAPRPAPETAPRTLSATAPLNR